MNTKKLFVHTLVDKHRSSLVRFLTKKLHNQQDAADIAQDAYLKMYNLNSPETLENARAFLFQTASNLAIDQLRRKTLHAKYISREVSHLSPEMAELESSTPSVEQTIDFRQQLLLLTQAINELPTKCRQAFVLQRNEGLTYSQIAEMMGVSVSAVEKYISHALKHCYRKLQ